MEPWSRETAKLAGLLDADAPALSVVLAKFQEMDGKVVTLTISSIYDDLLNLIREKGSVKDMGDVGRCLRQEVGFVANANRKFVHQESPDELIRKLKPARRERNLKKAIWFRSCSLLFRNPTIMDEDKLTLDALRERLLAKNNKKSDRMNDGRLISVCCKHSQAVKWTTKQVMEAPREIS